MTNTRVAAGWGPLAIAFRRVGGGDAALTGLPERERRLLAAAATPKRRAEFAAGRHAGRAALLRLLGTSGQGASIVRDEAAGSARPVPLSEAGDRLPAFLSITHASGLAAAAAAPSPLGIDLVTLEPLDHAFREESFAPDELAAWERWLGEAAPGGRAACVAFAAKEAALKWLGTGLALPLHGVRVAPGGPARPARLGGRIAAVAFPLDVDATDISARLEGWLAATPRRVLVAARGEVRTPSRA